MATSLIPSEPFDGQLPCDESDELTEEILEPEVDESFPVEYSLTSYGADYPVDSLVKRIESGAIFIPTFQRSYVWNINKASRFIESLLLGLPVPAIFLSREVDSQKLLVIDGQQRLRSLQFFYNGLFKPLGVESGVEFSLRGVSRHLNWKTYSTLTPDERLRLDDSIIHAIVIRQDEPDESGAVNSGPSSVYHIFERLNTGGVLLEAQEIRTCVYHGPFIDLLAELNDLPSWRALLGKVSSHMRDKELILRFLALSHENSRYQRSMKEFLNRFTESFRRISAADKDAFRAKFTGTVNVIREKLGDTAFRPSGRSKKVSAAVVDAVCTGVARRLQIGPIGSGPELSERYTRLLRDQEFQNATTSRTTDERNIETRLRLATAAFGDVP